MANPFVHVELNTTDVSKAKSFYGALFNWALEDIPCRAAYTMIKVGEGTGGGIMKHPVPGAPSAWLAYVQVDDIAASTKKAKSLGANVMKDVTEVMGMGAFSVIIDPTGAVIRPLADQPRSEGQSVFATVHCPGPTRETKRDWPWSSL